MLASHFLTIVSLLPLSFAVLLLPQPEPIVASPLPDDIDLSSIPETFRTPRHPRVRGKVPSSNGHGWLPLSRNLGSSSSTRRRALSHSHIGVGSGVDLAVIPARRRSLPTPQDHTQSKRSGSNSSIIPLGTSLSTYTIPLTLGSPPVIYPLQLDIASSDILLASTLCGSSCPASLGTSVNPYYDVSRASATFGEVNQNGTRWETEYGDGTQASGFVATETVGFWNVTVGNQVFGLINSTNLTLSSQQISGILGLGFPRLSTLARVLLAGSSSGSASSSASSSSKSGTSSAASSVSSSASPSASSSSTPYLPPLLESLVRTPHIPYPVFGLALVSPPSVSASSGSSTSSSASAPSASASERYRFSTGSLTLGGVSAQYVSQNPSDTSGRTVADIEWWDVVPFGRSASSASASSSSSVSPLTALAASSTPASTSRSSSSSSSSSASASGAGSSGTKRSTANSLNQLPSSLSDLEGEEYLYWALKLSSISVNGTTITPNSTYSSLGVPSVALLDVGTNGIYGPAQDVERIFALIQDAREVEEGMWAVPCNTQMTLGFSFGGKYIQLQPSDWIYAQVSGSSFCLAWPVATASTGDGLDWQLGTPFLKKVYSVFSYGINGVQAPLVGFLPIPDSAESTSTSTSTPASSSVPSLASASTSATSSSSVSASGSGSVTSSSSSSANPAAPTEIDPISFTQTITTTLPNQLLPSPSFSTPSYLFSTPAPSLGIPQYLGLANASAYTVENVPVVTLGNATTGVIVVGSGAASGGSGTRTSGAARTAERGEWVTGVILVVALLSWNCWTGGVTAAIL
ncbi:hypothetical protein JCM24511_08764 [Saitozyma sp. JCM 24511]|nr:hypothetical protein JCM24511_08764 [Saitozyma sp. JCM 24511]